MYLSDKEAKALLIDIGKKIAAEQFVSANDGNLTIRVDDDAVWASPTGVNKGDLTDEMLIKVRISDGSVIEGTWAPTSELEMHLNAYRTDDTLQSTCHAHPLNLGVLACAGIELDLPTTPAAALICGRVPVIPYCCSGSKALAECIIPYVKKFRVVNLANHGPISWGHTPIEAWYRMEDAEMNAHLAIELVRFGRLRPLNTQQVQELQDFHNMPVNPEALVAKYEGEENQEPAIPFSEYFNQLMKK